jgi:hypothetical protein
MAAVEPLDATYTPNLPKRGDREGHALRRAARGGGLRRPGARGFLDTGARRGFFIGDGTGVGKGREIAGIILDNWRQGRKKAVW